MAATMREVAERAGVSPKTVSRVLRKDRYVSDDVRNRVQAAVAELKYVPNMLAVTFRTGRDAAIGVAVPDIADPFFAEIVQAIESEARARQTAVIISSLSFDAENEQAAMETLLQRRVVGLIACPVAADQSYLAPWLERTPMVFVDREPRKLAADSVIEDDAEGARLATNHLLRHGHRRIAFIGDDTRAPTTLKRLHGYTQVLAEAGIFDDDLVHFGQTEPPFMDQALRRLTSLPDPPSAIFSSNARCSMEVFAALKRLGAEGLAIVSFGDFPMAASLDPPVTVIDQNPAAVGRFAAERLFLRIAEPQKRLRRRTVLPVSLTERGSAEFPALVQPI
jgi:LacI family transcriptional regulator